jgi:hypothetical protein
LLDKLYTVLINFAIYILLKIVKLSLKILPASFCSAALFILLRRFFTARRRRLRNRFGCAAAAVYKKIIR